MGALQEEIKKREALDTKVEELQTRVGQLEALVKQLLEAKN